MSGTSRESGMLIHNGLSKSLQTFSVYDVSGRLIEFHEARVSAKDGDPAFLTEYKYEGVTSTIIATKESVVKWDSSYDFDAQP